MTPANPTCALVERLQRTWPDWLPPALAAGASAQTGTSPLGGEVQALLQGRHASLPFFVAGGDVAWITVARDGEQLREAYRELRAWLLPSVAWEDPRGAFAPPVVTDGLVGRDLAPDGYLRWRSRHDSEAVNRVIDRLRQARELADTRPIHTRDLTPSLLELRQQFAAAIAIGDRPTAEATVEAIDRSQLDTAANTLFLRVRLWDHFGDPAQLVAMPGLEQLVNLRLPQRVRAAIARAFQTVYLAPPEVAGDTSTLLRAYAEYVELPIGPLVDGLGPSDGPELRLLRACRARQRGDTAAATRLLAEADDPLLRSLLGPLVQPSSSPPPPQATLEERFFEARKQLDWRGVQELGALLLDDSPEVVPILRKSLQLHPNPGLEERLGLLAPSPPVPVAVPPAAATEPVPQTWATWFATVTAANPEALEVFLDEHERFDGTTLRAADIQALTDALTEVLTLPDSDLGASRGRLLTVGLTEFIGECLDAPDFPLPGLIDVYRLLAHVWDRCKRGSAYPPDGQMLLELVETLLRLTSSDETALSDLVTAWWQTRPAKALLPFLLAAVEVFDLLGSAGHAEQVWMQAGPFLQRNREQLTLGEKQLWRQVGRRIGYEDSLLDEYVPLPASESEAEDPIRAADLSKIAIVSTREEQATKAAEWLRARTDADIIVVTGTHGGYSTDSARTADVIAYVWGASTHAIFRTFDKIDRRKIAYVQGTSASSIVRAVERWVSDNAVLAVS